MSYATKRMTEARWLGHGSVWPEGHRPCMKCEEMKPFSEFHKHTKCKGGYNSVCKTCRKPLSRKQYETQSTEHKLWYRAKCRAKERDQEFTLELDDIVVPDVCPVFLAPFVENTPFAASLDRIDSTRGYVKGNIQVLSTRANTLKSNATLDELVKLVDFLQKSNNETV